MIFNQHQTPTEIIGNAASLIVPYKGRDFSFDGFCTHLSICIRSNKMRWYLFCGVWIKRGWRKGQRNWGLASHRVDIAVRLAVTPSSSSSPPESTQSGLHALLTRNFSEVKSTGTISSCQVSKPSIHWAFNPPIHPSSHAGSSASNHESVNAWSHGALWLMK